MKIAPFPENEELQPRKKKFEFPHVFFLLFTLIIIMSVLTYVIPAGELRRHLGGDDRIRVLDPAQRLVTEDHAEPEGVVCGVALPDGHLMGGVELFHERGEVQAAWPSPDNGEAPAPPRP